MDTEFGVTKWLISPDPSTSSDNEDRSFQRGCGVCCQGVKTGGPCRDSPSYQCLGTQSSIPSNQDFSKGSNKHSHPSQNGQQNLHCLYQRKGRHPLEETLRPGMSAVELVPQQRYHNSSRAHCRNKQCQSRLGIESVPGPSRLETLRKSLPEVAAEVGKTGHRLFCSPSQSSSKRLLQLSSRPGCKRGRFFLTSMVQLLPLWWKNFTEVTEGKSPEGSPNCSSLDQSGVVPSLVRDGDRESSVSSTISEIDISPAGPRTPPTAAESFPSDCVVSVRQSLQVQGISDEAATITCAFWRKSTEKSYSSAWCCWCQSSRKLLFQHL